MRSYLYLVLILILFSSCKKEPFHPVSNEMKEYFAFQEGSYWIYKNDSTDSIDSTYVKSYFHTTDDHSYEGMRREVIEVIFKSLFLTKFLMVYIQCSVPEYATILNVGGAPAFCPEWQPNIKTTNSCLNTSILFYKYLPSDTINDIIFKNIIYSKIITVDSTSTNPNYYFREILFAKNIGIIKYSETSRYDNIKRSFSLRRYKIIQ